MFDSELARRKDSTTTMILTLRLHLLLLDLQSLLQLHEQKVHSRIQNSMRVRSKSAKKNSLNGMNLSTTRPRLERRLSRLSLLLQLPIPQSTTPVLKIERLENLPLLLEFRSIDHQFLPRSFDKLQMTLPRTTSELIASQPISITPMLVLVPLLLHLQLDQSTLRPSQQDTKQSPMNLDPLLMVPMKSHLLLLIRSLTLLNLCPPISPVSKFLKKDKVRNSRSLVILLLLNTKR